MKSNNWIFVFVLHACAVRRSTGFGNASPTFFSSNRFRPLSPSRGGNTSYREKICGAGVLCLHGITEWRDALDERGHREVLMLPFPANDALVPGQSISIVLKEGRFFDLFQDCLDFHYRILGMALMGEDALLDSLVLCEIDDYSVDAGYRGKVTVAVNLRAVGRATLLELSQMTPFMKGFCRELKDEVVVPSESATDLIIAIQSTSEALGRQAEWNHACRNPTGACDITHDDRVQQIEMASWASFSIAQDKSKLAQALAMTNAVHRLQLGLNVLLDETISVNSSPTAVRTDSANLGNFE